MKTLLATCGLLSLLLGGTRAQATLIDRGTLIYDTVNNISWTQDGALSGFHDWPTQTAFAANLTLAG